MNFDETRIYLKRIRWMDNEIAALIEDKKSYMELATKATSSFDGNGVRSSTCNDKIADIAAKIADTENEICARVDKLVDYKREVSNNIRKVEDKECQQILILKYARYMQMIDIADVMNMDRSTVYRKRKKGIEALQKILSESDKE